MHRLVVCLALALFANPAHACLNDIELPAHEREFRSSYRGPPAPPPTPPVYPPSNQLLFAGGAVFLVGALALALVGRRVRS
jgi:hypothetical protein